MEHDRSEGWDGVAERFIAARSETGVEFVRSWARDWLPPRSALLDIGCGTGIPVARGLAEDGFDIWGIDASPRMIDAFRRHLPGAPSACEAAQESPFFHRRFDAAIAIGLMFLLSARDQQQLVKGVAKALRPGGRFLFSAPREACKWRDLLTGRLSMSLGQKEYERLLAKSGLQLVGAHADEGGNFHYDIVKPVGQASGYAPA